MMARLGQVENLIVETNGCGEVFVSIQGTDTQIRISSAGGKVLAVTAHGCSMTPNAVNGLPAFMVSAI